MLLSPEINTQSLQLHFLVTIRHHTMICTPCLIRHWQMSKQRNFYIC